MKNFHEWWVSKDHRRKYSPDHPVYCAALEVWQELQLSDLEREAIQIACDAIGDWEKGGPIALGALCVLQDMIGEQR